MVGALYYEIHPQLWGQGIMSEAFAEVLRFAFEEVGLWTMSVSLARQFLHFSDGIFCKS